MRKITSIKEAIECLKDELEYDCNSGDRHRRKGAEIIKDLEDGTKLCKTNSISGFSIGDCMFSPYLFEFLDKYYSGKLVNLHIKVSATDALHDLLKTLEAGSTIGLWDSVELLESNSQTEVTAAINKVLTTIVSKYMKITPKILEDRNDG
jgi:hypothetical protein